MKLVITIVITFAVSVGLALVSMDDPGYMVLAREPYTIRMPLLLFVLLLFLAFTLLYLLVNFIVGVVRAPRRYRKWKVDSGERAARGHTMLGYARLIEGNWDGAEKSLLKKLEYNQAPLINYLGAAYAAHQRGGLERRNHYLDEALRVHAGQQLAINLTRARLLYRGGELPGSRDCLEDLRRTAPRNGAVVRLLAEVYRELGDWPSLAALLPVAKKLRALSDEELAERERLAFGHIVDSPALTQGSEEHNQRAWKALPRARRREPALVARYAARLLEAERPKEAEKVLRRALNRGFDEALIRVYGEVNSPFLEYQVQLAESLLGQHGHNPNLLHALARLHHYNNDFRQSAEYFQKALAAGATVEANLHYAALLEQMGEKDRALYYLKKGAEPSADAAGAARPVSRGELVSLNSGAERDAREVMPVVR